MKATCSCNGSCICAQPHRGEGTPGFHLRVPMHGFLHVEAVQQSNLCNLAHLDQLTISLPVVVMKLAEKGHGFSAARACHDLVKHLVTLRMVSVIYTSCSSVTRCRSYLAEDMAPPHGQAPASSSWILLLWVSAVALLPCSSCRATEADGGTLPPPAAGGCSRTEASSLLQLFPGLNLTAELPSWRLGTDCCTWEGVKCERGTGHVAGLDLGERFITAHVDAGRFLGLPRLSSINLSWNNFNYSSSFPSVLAGLPNLTHLNVSMEGTLALDQFPQLPRLVSLVLSPNPPAYELKLVNGGLGTLVNSLPAGLKQLHLDFVDLSDGSAGWCRALASALPKLQVLSLRRCSLSVDASCLSQLGHLSEIYLDDNDFSSGLPSFGSNFTSLRTLSLPGCGLTGRLPEGLLWLPKLEILDLSSNSITGNLPEFSAASVLRVLRLTLTGISGELPASIGYLKSMKELELASCNLTGHIPNTIANLADITSLVLSGNNLSGPIPPAIGGLEQLVLLDLSDNSLSGHIPAGMLSTSARLEVVLLQNNQLTGPIPTPNSDKLSRLTTFNMQNNSLSGSFPSSLLYLPSLRSLLLNKNQLGGQLEEIPNAIISSVLEEIDLSDNKLRGEIPSSVFKLPGLRTLSLSFNRFNGTVELSMLQNASMSKLDLSYNLLTVLSKPSDADSIFHSFRVLNLASCNLSGFPDFLRGQYQTVSFLDLSNNKIGGEIPTWIWQVLDGPIIALNLSHNLLEGFELPLPDIIQFKNFDMMDLHSNLLQGPLVLPGGLGFLDYSNNRFTSTFPEDIDPLLSSVFISFSGNNLSGEIPPSICNASSLQVLDLSDNGFSGTIPPCLANSSTLNVLNLRGNRFDGILPQNFGNQCSLSTLDLSENQLRGQIPKSLANCRQLEVLNLRQNNLVDIFPSWLGELPSLRVLVLRSNGFHDGVRCDSLPAGDGFRSMQILDLSSNGFVGELPSDCFDRFKEMMLRGAQNRLDIIGHGSLGELAYYQDSVKITMKGEEVEIKKILNILVAIDLSGNRFRGEIPSAMGKLQRLVLLNFSGNGLGGSIPAGLGDLANLESLDLSRNMLTGKIPDQLTRLSFLSVLNLSYNRLSGRIPPGGQLSTFPNSSFEGNAGLCGPPLSRGCSGDADGGEGRRQQQPAASPGVDWGSERIAFGLGAGVGVSCCPIFLWKKGFFEDRRGWGWGIRRGR